MTVNEPHYTHADMTGDGILDLVMTTVCADATVGNTRWLVYPGTGTGYGAAISWPLPTGFSANAFPFASRAMATCSMSQNYPEYMLADLTGDGRADLVLTITCADTNSGATHWYLAPNTGTGFGPATTQYALPWTGLGFTHRCYGDGFASPAYQCATGQNWPLYFVADLTGDGRLDLVHVRRCGDATVGNTRWLVYPGTATGFGAQQAWTLPTGYSANAFNAAGRATAACASGNNLPAFFVADLSGDGRADIVVHDDCSAAVSEMHWLVFRSTGSGFAASTVYSLPPGVGGAFFSQGLASAAPLCGSTPTDFQYVATDVTRDGFLDLVVHNDCADSTIGVSRWKFFPGSSTGFGAARYFALPTIGQADSLKSGLSALLACGAQNRPAYLVTDLTGDGLVDLVVHDTCSDATVGASRWLVSVGQCGP